MDITRLRYMADQIARNFAIQGEEQAIAATAEHIRKFWDPRMKAQLLSGAKGAGRGSMSELVARVVERMSD